MIFLDKNLEIKLGENYKVAILGMGYLITIHVILQKMVLKQSV